jgi:hypothetical protein
MYTLQDIQTIRDEVVQKENSGFCNEISTEIYKIVRKNKQKEDRPLQEESHETDYHKHVVDIITEELETKGSVFVQLANSSAADKHSYMNLLLFQDKYWNL